MSRRRAVLFLLSLVAVSIAVSLVASSTVQSPADAAARTAPPEASPILVPSEQMVLSTDVVTRGTARFGSPQQVTVAPSALKADPSVVTVVPAPGTQFNEGDVALTASGRPIFLLAGVQPMYRDLGSGAQGEDVRQLEAALSRLGFDPGTVDGLYDNSTERAVASWYQKAGFAPFSPTSDEVAAIRALRGDLATSRLDTLANGDAIAAAAADLASASAAEAAAVATAQRGAGSVIAAAAEADTQNALAAAELANKESALEGASTPAEVRAARADVAAARTAVSSTRLSGALAVSTAQDDADAARREAFAASAGAESANTALTNARSAQSITNGTGALIQNELSTAQGSAGIRVPADEVIFAAKTPVRVDEVAVAPGDPASGPVMTASDSNVAIDSSLPLEESPLVKVGMSVAIDEPTLGITATGVVTAVADSPGTNGVDGFHTYVEIAVEGSPPQLVGSSVRITIPIESTGGAVLAVPVSAVTLGADGSSRVQTSTNGELNTIGVEPGLSSDGFVEVVPIDKPLKAGDLVVVGFEQRATSGG